MAEIGRTFIVCVVFLGWFAILTNDIPSIFYYGGSRQAYIVPEEWGAEALFYGNITTEDNGTLIYDSGGAASELELSLDYPDCNIAWFWDPGTGVNACHVIRYWYFWGILIDSVDIEPMPLYRSYVTSKLDGNVSRFTMSDIAYQYYVSISFNESKWSSFDDAWNNGELLVWMGMGYSDTPSTISSWNIIAQLMFFQIPDIHPTVNALIAVSIWAPIGYLVYRLILMAIPFLGG